MNSTKKRVKKPVVRIFRELLAKTRPESQYLQGLPRGRVEMKVARCRALTLVEIGKDVLVARIR